MRVLAGLASAAIVLSYAGAASAQAVKPYILLIFDTSGSMSGSRIANAKTAVYNTVNATGEVVFALQRFGQVCDPTMACDCVRSTIDTSCRSGGCDGELPVVPLDPENQLDMLSWVDGVCDFAGGNPELVIPGGGTAWTPLAASLDTALTYYNTVIPGDPFFGCRPYIVVLLTDGRERCCGNPPASAANLLAAGIPTYVIAFGITAPDTEVDDIATSGGTGSGIYVDTGPDELAIALSNIVASSLLVEVCNGIDDDCDCPGDTNGDGTVCGPGDFNVDEGFALGAPCDNGMLGECLLTGTTICDMTGAGVVCDAPPGIPGMEICDGLDNDCDGSIDEGGICMSCPPEVCDGFDNDCDGMIDEGIPSVPCGSGVGECTEGMTACVSGMLQCVGDMGPFVETCDCLDNDCDGIVDGFAQACGVADIGECQFGSQVCTAMTCPGYGPCVGNIDPAAEICDGLDNDCDGVCDNPPIMGTGVPCGFSDVGECQLGTLECDNTAFACGLPQGLSCVGEVGPVPEICDGLDNNCNGTIDDVPGVGGPCGTACGVCTLGTLACDPTMPGPPVCVGGGGGGGSEVCNGLDDDCNCVVDDNLTDTGGVCGTDVGVCMEGTLECIAGMLECIGSVMPGEEVCDALDNDCDTEVDEEGCMNQPPCPDGTPAMCVGGMCVCPCTVSKINVCPPGYECDMNGFCVPSPCLGVTCPDCELCDETTGGCVALSCDPDEVCLGNACVEDNCYALGCPAGELCVDAACVADACDGVMCDDYHFCRDGECVRICADIVCGAGEACVDGACVADACAGVECQAGEVCSDGSCGPDLCLGLSCGPGRVCNKGSCIDDPCAYVLCPQSSICEDGQCVTSNPSPTFVHATGGCSCVVGRSAARGNAVLVALLALGLLGSVFRWRRRRGS